MITLKERLIRYEDLIPCKSAFIDAKTPGSNQKDNFSIIGGGVSENKHQKVNLTEKHGFCIGGAGQPPKIKNSPHSHFTAEVFMIHSGTWKFYWNNDCKAEAVLTPGDIISLPINMFRGFENIGQEYGMIFSILGHDDAGGGVVWLPRVIEEAKRYGLVLLESGKLVDTTIGETIPEGQKPMPPLTPEQLATLDQYTLEQMMQYVGKANTYTPSTFVFANKTPETLFYYDIIGPKDAQGHNFHILPGDNKNGDQFNVYGLESKGQSSTGEYKRDEVEVFIVHRGTFKVQCGDEQEQLCDTLKAGDMITFPRGMSRMITSQEDAFAYIIVGEDYPEAPTLVN